MRGSKTWGSVAAGSVLALGVWAPSGLVLLAFLGLVILSHEAGHLVVARRAGMRPTEFFWGFGPEVIAIERNGCRYGLRALFLGGYVRLEGMTPSAAVPPGFGEAGTYRAARHRDRLATILAGPAVNLIAAVAAFTVAGLLTGLSPLTALGSGFGDAGRVVTATSEALWIWVSNLGGYVASVFDWSGSTEAPVRFLSPVAQAEVSGWAVGNGTVATMRWFGVLSCAIGAVNLLPLPPLDGAHALAAALEGAVQRMRPRRPVHLDVSRLVPLAYLTVAALLLLSVSALVLDLRELT